MNKSDKECIQVWSVSREGISRTRWYNRRL